MWVALALLAAYALYAHLLPATTTWAADRGGAGWIGWSGWAAGWIGCLYLAVSQANRLAMWGFHVNTVVGLYMAWTAPISTAASTLAVLTGLYLWVLAYLAVRNTWQRQKRR